MVGHVLHQREQAGHRHRQAELDGGAQDREHRRGAGHVVLHPLHRAGALQVEAAGVEGDALADQRDVSPRPGGTVAQGHQPRWGGRATAHREHRAEAAPLERLTFDDLMLQAVLGGQPGCLGRQIGRPERAGRLVDQVARPGGGADARLGAAQGRPHDLRGLIVADQQDHLGQGGLGAGLVALEAVGGEPGALGHRRQRLGGACRSSRRGLVGALRQHGGDAGGTAGGGDRHGGRTAQRLQAAAAVPPDTEQQQRPRAEPPVGRQQQALVEVAAELPVAAERGEVRAGQRQHRPGHGWSDGAAVTGGHRQHEQVGGDLVGGTAGERQSRHVRAPQSHGASIAWGFRDLLHLVAVPPGGRAS